MQDTIAAAIVQPRDLIPRTLSRDLPWLVGRKGFEVSDALTPNSLARYASGENGHDVSLEGGL